MNTAVMFSNKKDDWSTPQDTFDALDAEFHFALDCAATTANAKCARWLGPGGVTADALVVAWGESGTVCWLNPPYSQVRAFMAKAAAEAARGCTVVALVPARTCTRWWHTQVWDAELGAVRPGVEIRFLRGRLKFGGTSNSAPFPSVVVIFRPRPRFEDLPDFLSPEEFSTYTRIGRSTVYDCLRRDEIPHKRYGRVIRIPKSAVRMDGVK